MDNATILSSARAIGLTTTLFQSGYHFAASHTGISPLYTQPSSVSNKVFVEVYYKGIKVVAPLAVVSVLCHAGLAYAVPEQRVLLIAAAVSTAAAPLGTQLFMAPTITRLIELSKLEGAKHVEKEAEVTTLLKRWVWMNYVRSAVTLTGGLLGVLALIETGPYTRL